MFGLFVFSKILFRFFCFVHFKFNADSHIVQLFFLIIKQCCTTYFGLEPSRWEFHLSNFFANEVFHSIPIQHINSWDFLIGSQLKFTSSCAEIFYSLSIKPKIKNRKTLHKTVLTKICGSLCRSGRFTGLLWLCHDLVHMMFHLSNYRIQRVNR